jgi:hypothetical protein
LSERFGKIEINDGRDREVGVSQFLAPFGMVSGQKLGARHLEKVLLSEYGGRWRGLRGGYGRAGLTCVGPLCRGLFPFPLPAAMDSTNPGACGRVGVVHLWGRRPGSDRQSGRRGGCRCRWCGGRGEGRERMVVDACDRGRRGVVPSRGLGEGRHSGLRRVSIVHFKVGAKVRVAFQRFNSEVKVLHLG